VPRLPRPGRPSAVALALLLCAASAFAAGEGDGLRPTLPAGGAAGNALAQAEGPTIGARPASGAGDTGFVSADQTQYRAKRKKKKPETAIAEAPPQPAAPLQERAPRTNVATGIITGAIPSTAGPVKRAKPDEEPYDPVGVHAGAFLLKPSIEVYEGYDDNPFRVQNGPGSSFTTLKSALSAKSDWSRHEMSLDLRGSFTHYSDVDHNDRPAGDKEAIDRVLVTSLFGRTLPLIRYELTDVPVPADRPCSCGAAFPLIASVKGRSDDIFIYPGHVQIHPLVFRTPLGQNSRIEQYQVHQTERGAAIDIMTTGPIDLAGLKQEVVAALAKAGLADAEIEIKIVSALERHKETGKLRRFIPLPTP